MLRTTSESVTNCASSRCAQQRIRPWPPQTTGSLAAAAARPARLLPPHRRRWSAATTARGVARTAISELYNIKQAPRGAGHPLNSAFQATLCLSSVPRAGVGSSLYELCSVQSLRLTLPRCISVHADARGAIASHHRWCSASGSGTMRVALRPGDVRAQERH